MSYDSLPEYRKKGIELFATKLHDGLNIKLEKLLAKKCKDEQEYLFVVYQIYGFLLKYPVKKVSKIVEEKRYGWNSKIYDEFKNKQEEYDNFLEFPFEVSEGVIECINCKQKKILTCQKQLRGGDESMTTISTCLTCKTQWTYSG